MVKLTLIKPNIGRREHSLYVDEGRMEPLPLGILAALTPPDIEVVLYDDRMEQIPYDEPTDLVAITVETFTARRAYEISAEYQKRGVSVVMGGMHAKLIPNEVAEHCDCVIIGDAEPVWAQMCADFRVGKLKKRYAAVQPECPQEGIIARRDIFEEKGYTQDCLIMPAGLRGAYHLTEMAGGKLLYTINTRVQDMILEAKVPTEMVSEVRDDGSIKEVERKLYPGYVFVKMVYTDETWYVVRNIRGCTGFVGPSSKPVPLTEAEVYKMGVETRVVEVSYGVGDQVRIIDGPLEDFVGIVDELDTEKNYVKVTISMFGRETPVELELNQAEKLDD